MLAIFFVFLLQCTGFKKEIRTSQINHKSCGDRCFFSSIKKSLEPYKGGIRKNSIWEARKKRHAVHYQILDGKLYRSSSCLFPSRCKGIEHFLLPIVKKVPNVEFVVNVSDSPMIYGDILIPIFSFSSVWEINKDIQYPAWVFHEGGPAIPTYPSGLGNWDIIREQLNTEQNKYAWDDRLDVLYFRGSRTSPERDGIIKLSRKRDDVDASYVPNQSQRSMEALKEAEMGPVVDHVSLEDHCKYKYLLNFRGVAASFRFQYSFLCKSVVFHADNGFYLRQFFYDDFKPWIHYVPFKRDWSDIEEKLNFIKENPNIAQNIAEAGYNLIWNHLTIQNMEKYWIELLTKYEKLLTYKVRKNKKVKQLYLRDYPKLLNRQTEKDEL